VRYKIGTLPDGEYHVYVYGLADDFDTGDADFLADKIERRLNLGLKCERQSESEDREPILPGIEDMVDLLPEAKGAGRR
jgi:hypothetical protein